jgi:hypothetical protein
MEFGAQNQCNRVIYPSIENFKWSKKKYNLRVKKLKKKSSEPKNVIWHRNQYGRATYPSIGNCTKSKKKYTFRGQKGKNKLSEPKNGT